MKIKGLFLFGALLFGYKGLQAGVRVYELYPNINTVGIMVVFDTPVPDTATSQVFYEEHNGSSWGAIKQGLELSRVTGYQYAGCIFFTKPYTQYRVRIKIMAGTNVITDLTQTVTTRKEVTTTTAQRTFYVSPNGTGISQNSGTPGSLDQSLLNGLIAGDKVVLLPGTYYIGELEIKSSGTEQNPIVFEGGAGVTIDGSIAPDVVWTRVNTNPSHRDYNMFYANLGALNTNCIVVDNKRLYPYRNLYELSLFQTIRSIDGNGNIAGNYPINISGFFRDGRNPSANQAPYVGFNNNTYIKFVDGSDTTGKSIHVSRYTHAFKATGKSNIQFRGINFKYYGCAKLIGYRSAMFWEDCDSLLIDSCHFQFCDRGMIFRGNSDNNIIQRSRFDDDFGDWTYFQFKETNEDYPQLNTYYPNFFPYKYRYIETGRVYFDHNFTGRGNILRRNVFNGGCDGITCPDTPGDTTTSRHFDIYENEFMHGSDDAFEVDGDASNVRVWGNTMHGTGNGISISSPCYGPVYVMRNVIYDLNTTPYEYIYQDLFGYHLYSDTPRASPMKLNAAYCDIPGKVYFLHNTCDVGTNSYGFLTQQPQAQSSWQNVVSYNNIIYNQSNYYTLWVRCTDKVDFDYNNYYTTGIFTARKDRNGYAIYNSIKQVSQNILGDLNDPNSFIETHSKQLNPVNGWVNEPAHDYHLLAQSNMIDSGLYIAGINDDYAGTAPDIGAFEYRPIITARDTSYNTNTIIDDDTSYTTQTVVLTDTTISDTVVVSTTQVDCDSITTVGAITIDSVTVTTPDTVYISYSVTQTDTVAIVCTSNTTDSVFIPAVGTGINDVSGEEVLISPNPNNGTFTIVSPLLLNRCQITMHSMTGAVVYSSQPIDGRSNYTIYLDKQLPAGVYFLKVTGVSSVTVKQLVIE